MQYLQWNSDLNTGINEIDVQHRRMLDLINRLHRLSSQDRAAGADANGNAMLAPLFPEAGVDRFQIRDAIEDLIDYTLSHFKFEEALMEQSGHPASHDHRKAHQAFRRHILEVLGQFEAGEDVLEDLLRMLGVWLFKHIAHDDQELACLERKCVRASPADNEAIMSSEMIFKDAAA